MKRIAVVTVLVAILLLALAGTAQAANRTAPEVPGTYSVLWQGAGWQQNQPGPLTWKLVTDRPVFGARLMVVFSDGYWRTYSGAPFEGKTIWFTSRGKARVRWAEVTFKVVPNRMPALRLVLVGGR